MVPYSLLIFNFGSLNLSYSFSPISSLLKRIRSWLVRVFNNLANSSEIKPILSQLRKELEDYQKLTDDPRLNKESPWDSYPFYWKGYATRNR